jgi:hypothetical protein
VDIDVHAANGTVHHINGMSADDHLGYVATAIARTITAQHTFSPSVVQAPFLLGQNAKGQTIDGLKAHQLARSVSAGSGLTGGGELSSDVVLSVSWGTPTISTIQPDDTANAGASVNPARSDHRHAISASAPGAIYPEAPAAEGAATSFARSDHQHSASAGVPGSILPDDTAYKGVATSFALSDHRHGITASIPGSILPDNSADEGVATSFSRSDHRHGITTAAPGANSVNLAASTKGTGNTFSRSDHTHQLDQSIAPTWTNDHVFRGLLTSRHHMPELTDTYDLGSSTKLWRKGWLSELDTILFAQNTITLLGGWLLVSKGEGSVVTEVDTNITQIDFGDGASLAANDFVLFRASLKMEYMQIVSNVNGNIWNVTRNIDGSGANAWPAGAPYVNLGYNGTGRIELNAYDTPRIQIITQGSAYNAQVEVSRLGDLNGNWGYTGQTYGIALGEYGANKANLTWDAANGLRLRTYTTTVLQLDNAGNADITGKLRLPGTNSALAIGSTPPTASNSGTGLWLDRTGLYSLASNVQQIKIDATTGKLWGGSTVYLDSTGVTVKSSDSAAAAPNSFKFDYNGSRPFAIYNWMYSDYAYTEIYGHPMASRNTEVRIVAESPSSKFANLYLYARNYSGADASLSLYKPSSGSSIAQLAADQITLSGDVAVSRGLSVTLNTTMGGTLSATGNITTTSGTYSPRYNTRYRGHVSGDNPGGGSWVKIAQVSLTGAYQTNTIDGTLIWTGGGWPIRVNFHCKFGVDNIWGAGQSYCRLYVQHWENYSTAAWTGELVRAVRVVDNGSICTWELQVYRDQWGHSDWWIDAPSSVSATFYETEQAASAGTVETRQAKFVYDSNGDLHIERFIERSTTISASVYRAGTQSIPNATWTAISHTNALWDDQPAGNNHWSASSPTRLTVRVAGTYEIVGNAEFASNATGARSLGIKVNGVFLAVQATPASLSQVTVSTQWKCSVGDYIELFAYQTSGGSLDIAYGQWYSPRLSIARVP